MAEVRKVDYPLDAAVDFAPSEIYIVVLTKDDNETLCQTGLRWDSHREQTLKRIIDSSFRLLDEVLA